MMYINNGRGNGLVIRYSDCNDIEEYLPFANDFGCAYSVAIGEEECLIKTQSSFDVEDYITKEDMVDFAISKGYAKDLIMLLEERFIPEAITKVLSPKHFMEMLNTKVACASLSMDKECCLNCYFNDVEYNDYGEISSTLLIIDEKRVREENLFEFDVWGENEIEKAKELIEKDVNMHNYYIDASFYYYQEFEKGELVDSCGGYTEYEDIICEKDLNIKDFKDGDVDENFFELEYLRSLKLQA